MPGRPASGRVTEAEATPSATGVPLREAEVRGVRERRRSGAGRALPLAGLVAAVLLARRRRR